MVCPYNGILLCSIRKNNLMNLKNIMVDKRSQAQEYILCDFIHAKF